MKKQCAEAVPPGMNVSDQIIVAHIGHYSSTVQGKGNIWKSDVIKTQKRSMVWAGTEKGWEAGQGNEDPFVCENRRY